MELTSELAQKIADYQPSEARLDGVHDVPLLFIVGTSGAGKDTLMKKLLAERPQDYHPFITHTTRTPRINNGQMEHDGLEYHFIDAATALRMLHNQDFIEANLFSGNMYGTSLQEMEEALQEHKIVVSNIDVNGVRDFISLGLNVRPVFILPPSYDIWQQRLLKRYEGHEIDQADWLRRMKAALYEVSFVLANENFYLVINDDLDQTAAAINEIGHGGEPAERRPQAAIDVATDIIEHIKSAISA
jgi:guanylate kinase